MKWTKLSKNYRMINLNLAKIFQIFHILLFSSSGIKSGTTHAQIYQYIFFAA